MFELSMDFFTDASKSFFKTDYSKNFVASLPILREGGRGRQFEFQFFSSQVDKL